MKKPTFIKVIFLFISSLLQKEKEVKDEDYPKEEQWWNPIERATTQEEKGLICNHCERALGPSLIKICPNCQVKLHSDCYEDTANGDAYASPDCDACKHRTYWR